MVRSASWTIECKIEAIRQPTNYAKRGNRKVVESGRRQLSDIPDFPKQSQLERRQADAGIHEFRKLN
jgi:hypothetical protein